MDVGSRVCMSMEDLRKTCWAVPRRASPTSPMRLCSPVTERCNLGLEDSQTEPTIPSRAGGPGL